MGGQIECNRQPLLAGGQIVAEELVGILGGGEAGVLANGPGAARIHGRPVAAQIGREARQGVHRLDAFQIVGGI